ncbi:hypothetical protein AtDm6_3042 [Acetobacter tropicalis]|uniref:Uncharacterized protein n=1 Tax=Acetobacter tropicalis TaxID=104102 RepID=A0A094ZFN1_9PROT|nr:hypothetical protein AtDm6_3042 [Acetobacter tropicalis]
MPLPCMPAPGGNSWEPENHSAKTYQPPQISQSLRAENTAASIGKN